MKLDSATAALWVIAIILLIALIFGFNLEAR